MAQSYVVYVFFFVGLVSGIILTMIVSTFGVLDLGRIDLLKKVYHRDKLKQTSNKFTHRAPMSHEEVDQIRGPDKPVIFPDGHFHKDTSALAEELYKKVRVLCWVMTSSSNLKSKAVHVKATWAKRCNKVVFVSEKHDKNFPAIGIQVPDGRDHLTAKTMQAFQYVYHHHFNDADWFMKADDDTYVIVENLRYMLSSHKPSEPIFFGHHFKTYLKQGYFSGGGGYVLSKEALTRFGKRKNGECTKDGGAEDLEMGRCMEKLGVKTGDSRDALGRSRFHCFNPETHLDGGYPDWYYQYDKYGAKKGAASMSDYAITFHYVSTQQMYHLEYFIYHLRPYGLLVGNQHLNKAANKTR